MRRGHARNLGELGQRLGKSQGGGHRRKRFFLGWIRQISLDPHPIDGMLALRGGRGQRVCLGLGDCPMVKTLVNCQPG